MQRAAAAERFRLIQQLQDRFPVLWLVKKLQVARSGYYSWMQRQNNPANKPPSNLGIGGIKRFQKVTFLLAATAFNQYASYP